MPGVFRWEAYSPEHQVELTSHAVRAGRYLYIFDPIPLAAQARAQLLAGAIPVAIVVTNDNHQRDALNWRKTLRTPIWTSMETPLDIPQAYRFMPGIAQWFDWKLFRLPGGSKGEMAFLLKNQGLIILGDAVTNLPKYGLSLLTAKYCEDQPTLKHSVRMLAIQGFDKLLMAHGEPLLERASARIEQMPSLK